MDKVAVSNRTNLIRISRCDCGCCAAECQKLDLIGLSLTMNKHDGSDITGF